MTCTTPKDRKRPNQGRRVGSLVATLWLGDNVWRCVCDCGESKDVNSTSLARTEHCGCKDKETRDRMNAAVTADRLGQVYGEFTVVARAGSTSDYTAKWLCRCAAGHESTRRGNDLANPKRPNTCRDCSAARKAAEREELAKVKVGEAYRKTFEAALYNEVNAERAEARGKLGRKAYRKAHPDQKKEEAKRYAKKYPEKVRARANGRRKAAPPWVNMVEVERVYVRCAEKNEQTGVRHHVDHIIPVKGSTVCGLHVPWNLEIIPALENMHKHNTLLPHLTSWSAGAPGQSEFVLQDYPEAVRMPLLGDMYALPTSVVCEI